MNNLLDAVIAAKLAGGGRGGGGGSGLTDDVKQALMDVVNNVGWKNGDGQQYIDELEAALYPLNYITAVYTQSGPVYESDSLDSLKADLVVTAFYQGGTSKTVTDYTLSGTLIEGTSTITVSYGGKTATFDVTVSAISNLWETTDQAFDGGSIETDVALFETDIDFTIAVDVTLETNPTGTTAPGNRYMLFRLGSNFTMLFGKNGSASTEYRFECFSKYLYIGEVGTTRQGIVVTHSEGSNQYNIWWRKEGGDVANGALDNAVFSALTNPVILGASSGVHQLPKGVLNHALISPAVWNSDKISEFLDF